jgi:LysR family glycine cleavage system transcriptional activator
MDWRRIPSLSALRAFEAQARLGGFTAAARELNITQAAVAQHVRRLEDFFSCALVQRQGRSMGLTDKGHRLTTTLTDGFSTIEAGVADLLADTETRPLSVSTTPSFAENWLMPRLGAFWSGHPGIGIALRPEAGLVDLRRDNVDLAIRYGRGNWSGMDCEKLAPADFVVVGVPALLKDRAGATPADLSDLRWLIEPGFAEQYLWAESFGLDLPALQVTEFPTNMLVLSATRTGYGLSVQPRALVEADIAAGRLIAGATFDVSELGYYMLTRPGGPSERLATFMSWLRRVR